MTPAAMNMSPRFTSSVAKRNRPRRAMTTPPQVKKKLKRAAPGLPSVIPNLLVMGSAFGTPS
jgi:hypothetical protein